MNGGRGASAENGPAAFDPCGPLPRPGTHVLEASAGTGKTYTIAALAARYLADGVPLGQLLMVTFSRAATQELRERIRARLTETEAGLRRVLDGQDPGEDSVMTVLATGSEAELRERLRRITTALADFDAATIATTHEFCGRMLDGLGILAEQDPSAQLVDQINDLTREVAADFWLRAYAGAERPDFGWEEARRIAQAVVEHDGRLAPDGDPLWAPQLAFGRAVRAEVQRRKAARGLYTYDDLLVRLHAVLTGRVLGTDEPDEALAGAARRRLRERYAVVLIDEFQDTDPMQWEIVRLAFAGHGTLVLIGDPKQAIYAFRGADVYSYLAAVSEADSHHYTLATNFRSDAPLVEALDAVLGGAELGDERIVVRPVTAHQPHARLAIDAEPARATPLRLRVIPPPERTSDRHGPKITPLRDQITRDLVAEVAALLRAEATLELRQGELPRRVEAGDIAVLVKSNWLAEKIRQSLTSAGIPAVHAGATSVYDTPEADDWLTLLRACEQPRAATIRDAALTCFVGWTFAELATADEDALNRLAARIRTWAKTLEIHGVAALLEVMTGAGLVERLLGEPGGDRRLTDVRHIAQALHAARDRHHLGVAQLIDWLRTRRTEAGSGNDERTRRLETDASAVQVMTVHRSKGLQFPIVCLPDLWDARHKEDDRTPFGYHGGGERMLFLPARGGERMQALRQRLEEKRGESLRLLYVAMTRAQCQVLTWWAGHDGYTRGSAWHRMLFRGHLARPEPAYPCETSPGVLDLARTPGISVEEITGRPSLPDPVPPKPPGALSVRRLDREIDLEWRRTSYSGLTAQAHEHAYADVSEVPGDDEHTPEDPEPATPAGAPTFGGALDRPSPMAELPRGTAFGTLVHAIYENFDPHADDLPAELERIAAHWLARVPAAGLTAPALATALLPGVRTPLGELAGNRALCDIAITDRLAELDFELPLGGGDSPAGHRRVVLGEVSGLLARHLAPGDPLLRYPDHLADPLLAEQALRGFLVGSIDAVLRVPEGDTHRYLIVDYKTNWLGPDPAMPLLVGHYQRAAMAEAMMHAHYPLQALLYSVALHRFLRWRQPGYDPRVHLGGVGYLFVRGMAGPDTPVVDGTPCGVFGWRPPPALVSELSDLLEAR